MCLALLEIPLRATYVHIMTLLQIHNIWSLELDPLSKWESLPLEFINIQVPYALWQCRLWSFKSGATKLEKSTVVKWNYWILEISVMGRCQKVPKFDFQSQFFMSKIIGIFLIFFSLKNINLGAHFLLLTFFDNINF